MKRIIFALVFCSVAITSIAQEEVYSSSGKPVSEYRKKQQEEDRKFDKSKLIFGGGVILSVGSGITDLGLAPVIGYRFTDKFSAGIGLGYEYLKIKDYLTYRDKATNAYKSYTLTSSTYTGSLWARYIVWNNIFIQAEPQMYSLENAFTTDGYTVVKERITFPRMMVGGGIRQPVSDRVSIVATLLYDVLQDKKNPYRNNLDVRFGVNVGF